MPVTIPRILGLSLAGRLREWVNGQAQRSDGDRGQVALRLRVGISGHRQIGPHHPGIAGAVAEVLAAVMLKRASMSTDSTLVGLTVVSSLAEGADRVLANAILDEDGQLEVVLPVEAADYIRDFGSDVSKADFTDLLARAVAVDTVPRAESREHAYEAAGHAVVDRSDVMVVAWDGQPARGRGGTAEIYEYAEKSKKPVFWIRVDDDRAELVIPDPAVSLAPLPPEALNHLDRYNRVKLRGAIFAGPSPLLPHQSDASLAARPLVRHVSRYFIRADAVAKRCQRRWFWVTRLMYALAALAVLIVAAQILFAPRHEHYARYEFVTLVCVTALFLVARFSPLHERWISARYLAEQIRSVLFLGLAGVATPGDAITSAGRPTDTVGESDWAERAVSEIWWSRPRNDPGDDVTGIREVLNSEWILDQLCYHTRTSRKYKRRGERFNDAAIVLFTLSAVAALLHSLSKGSADTPTLHTVDYLSIVIPAVGAALSGYGAQRDYARHAERSARFAVDLAEARDQLRNAQSLRDIQQVALSVRRLMRGEATDWYTAVRRQDVEPP